MAKLTQAKQAAGTDGGGGGCCDCEPGPLPSPLADARPGTVVAVPSMSLLNRIGELLPLVAGDMADAVSDEKESIAESMKHTSHTVKT